MRTLIVGCGYLGQAVAQRLVARGQQVFGLRRSPAGADEVKSLGVEPLVGDLTRLEDLRSLPGPFDFVVNTVSSSRGGASGYQEVYLGGARNLVNAFALGGGLKKLVHVGSTSVYGQTDGGWVNEDSVTQPAAETGRILIETERVFLAAAQDGFPVVLLRAAGIYGPQRGHLFRQFLKGEARLNGDGSRWLNMIHRDDLAELIAVALERGTPGRIYNAADDEPPSQAAFFQWLSARTGLPFPPPAAVSGIAGSKRGNSDKRVDNGRARAELGWALRYPTFREGYEPLLREGASTGPCTSTGSPSTSAT